MFHIEIVSQSHRVTLYNAGNADSDYPNERHNTAHDRARATTDSRYRTGGRRRARALAFPFPVVGSRVRANRTRGERRRTTARGDEAREGSRLPRTRARVAGRSGRHARSRGEVFMRGAAEGAAREPNGWFGDERDGDGCAGGCAQRARV